MDVFGGSAIFNDLIAEMKRELEWLECTGKRVRGRGVRGVKGWRNRWGCPRTRNLNPIQMCIFSSCPVQLHVTILFESTSSLNELRVT